MKLTRTRRDALAGDGPIVNRARVALAHTAKLFGTVVGTDQTSATVRTADGINLTLSYSPGNYIFSRVYNLRITAALPQGTSVPSELELSFRGKGVLKYVPKKQGSGSRPAAGPRLNALNKLISQQLENIDLVESDVSGRALRIVPMGGSYVWVLIPPVFKATAFPAGEVARILDLIRTFRSFRFEESGTSVA